MIQSAPAKFTRRRPKITRWRLIVRSRVGACAAGGSSGPCRSALTRGRGVPSGRGLAPIGPRLFGANSKTFAPALGAWLALVGGGGRAMGNGRRRGQLWALPPPALGASAPIRGGEIDGELRERAGGRRELSRPLSRRPLFHGARERLQVTPERTSAPNINNGGGGGGRRRRRQGRRLQLSQPAPVVGGASRAAAAHCCCCCFSCRRPIRDKQRVTGLHIPEARA